MIKISIERRKTDYIACLNNDARVWASGQNEREAIGALLLTHGSKVGVALHSVSDCPAGLVAGVNIMISFGY